MLLFFRFRAAALLCLMALSAAQAQSPVNDKPPAAAPQEVDAATPIIASALDADLFYELLLGELLTSHGDLNSGYTLILDVARRTKDEQLFRRAAEIAMESRIDKYSLIVISAWLQALPESRDANLYMLRALVMLNRIQDTIGPIRLELSRSSTEQKISTLHALPHLFAHASDRAEVARVVERAVADHLADPAIGVIVWITLGRLHMAAQNLPQALQALRNAHALEPQNESVARLGLELLAEDVEAAEPLLTAYFQGKSAQPQLRVAYARLLMHNNRLKEAHAQAQAVTEEYPDALDAWLMLAALHLEAEQLDAAQKVLEHLTEKLSAAPAAEDPSEMLMLMQTYLMRAHIARLREQWSEVERWLAHIPSTHNSVDVQRLRITSLLRKGQQKQALELIRALAADLDDNPRSRLRIEAQLLREEELHAAAYTTLARALALLPKSSEERDDVQYEMAIVAEKLGRMDEMERLLRQIIARNPQASHALNALGFSLADRNMRLPEAKALIVRALELTPGDPFITDSLGWVEFRLGNLQEALRLLEFAFEKQPHAEIAAHLGEVLWLLKARDRALSVWREGWRLDKNDSALQETLKRLEIAF